MRRKKKKGAKDVESAHLDGAGSGRSFGSATAGSVPEAFFVAPRNAPRIFHQDPLGQSGGGGRDLPGRDPPATAPLLPQGNLSPSQGGIPPGSSPPPAALMLIWDPQTIKGGCRRPLPAAVPTGSPATWPPVLGDLRATRGPGDTAGRSPRAGAGVPERCSPRQAPVGLAVAVVG